MDNEDEDTSFIDNKDLGTSDFGERLDYGKPKYRDVWCAVLYYLHLAAIVGITIYFWVVQWPDIEAANDDIKDNTDEESWTDGFDWTGVIVAITSCAVLGLIIGFIWLQVLKKFAGGVIKFMLFLNIIVWIAVIVMGFVDDQTDLIIFGAIMAVIWILYTWCIWGRIRFASVLLALGSSIISSFSGTVCVSFTVIIFSILWIALWMMSLMGYLWTTGGEETTDAAGDVTYKYTPNGWIIFAFIISLYWGLQVNQNIIHTTACGVAATWYFTPPNKPIKKPVSRAFNRSMTTSFGSICMGSLIVAILEAIRAVLNASSRENNNLCMICIRCCMSCITRCIEWFNKYAYAHCAIYGTSFIDSAKQTWALFTNRGILALINDDLSGLGLFCGNLVSLVICGLTGWGIAYLFYGDNPDKEISDGVVYGLAIYGAIAGFILSMLVLTVVSSAIISLFVCFAEEPAVIHEYRPHDFNNLVDAKQEFKQIYDTYGDARAV